jgi:hypothetical protein
VVLAGVGVRLLDRLGAPRILDLIASLGAEATTFSCVLVNAVHEDCWRIQMKLIDQRLQLSFEAGYTGFSQRNIIEPSI